MPEIADLLPYIGEAVKFLGGLASFYAVVKLRQIERRYLSRATIPELVVSIEDALSKLNVAMLSAGDQRSEIFKALNQLTVDVANVQRKCRGDSARLSKHILDVLSPMRPKRWFWERRSPMRLDKRILLEIHGMGHGLVHSLRNDMKDDRWSVR